MLWDFPSSLLLQESLHGTLFIPTRELFCRVADVKAKVKEITKGEGAYAALDAVATETTGVRAEP